MSSNPYMANQQYYPQQIQPESHINGVKMTERPEGMGMVSQNSMNNVGPPKTNPLGYAPTTYPGTQQFEAQNKSPEGYPNNPYGVQNQNSPSFGTVQSPTVAITNQMETVSLNDQINQGPPTSVQQQSARQMQMPQQPPLAYPPAPVDSSTTLRNQQSNQSLDQYTGTGTTYGQKSPIMAQTPTGFPISPTSQQPSLNERQQQRDVPPPNQQHLTYASQQKPIPLTPNSDYGSKGFTQYPNTIGAHEMHNQPVSGQYAPSNAYSGQQPGGYSTQPRPPNQMAMNQRYPPHVTGAHGQPQSQPYYGAPGMQGTQMQQQPPAFQQQQQQRLDPDAMPSVVQVIEDDKAKYCVNGEVMYTTAVPATVPPLCTTLHDENSEACVRDGGTARPNHIRATVYQVPSTEDVLKATSIPLGVIVKPFDEEEVTGNMLIPVTHSEIVRCNRCKTYMNPYMRFIDGGRRFQCALCHHISEVSPSFFANLDHTGQRLDKYERPELFLGSYEFRATAEFCRNGILNCRRPHIIFAFELTVNSKPILYHIAKQLPMIIRNNLPTDPLNPGSPPPLVGFATYNSKIQMYDVANNGHSHIICDVSSTFPPFTSFLVDPLEYSDQIESFLSSLPSLVNDDELETETILGPVVEAVFQTAQFDNSNWFNPNPSAEDTTDKDPKTVIPVGKVYLFHCTLPTYGQDGVTPGKLKQRWTTSLDEIRKVLGTDKEKQILTPEPSKYYNKLAEDCVTNNGSGVEMFLFPPVNGPYLDIATISELVRLTGTGAIYKYYNDYSDRFIADLKTSLQSSFAFDAIMKVRTSTGIRAFEYVGNYYARTTSDIECAVINSGSSIGVEFKYDDKLPEDEFVIIQIATLYTSVSGDRRVRIHNMALSICQTVADVFRTACCDTIMNMFLRQTVNALRSGEKNIQQIKESLITRVVGVLTAYRKHCAQSGSSLGQLILPEALKLLPVYLTGLLKCDAIDGGPEMMPDDKAYAQIRCLGAINSTSQVILYPRLLRLQYNESDELGSVHCRCSSQRLSHDQGVAFILENGFYIFLYLPVSNVSSKQVMFLRNVFGVETIQHVHPEMTIPQLLNDDSQYFNQLVNKIRTKRKLQMKIQIVRQGMDKMESVMKTFLYEDKKQSFNTSGDSGKFDSISYVDLLCHLHKEIRAQLN